MRGVGSSDKPRAKVKGKKGDLVGFRSYESDKTIFGGVRVTAEEKRVALETKRKRDAEEKAAGRGGLRRVPKKLREERAKAKAAKKAAEKAE